MIGRTIAQPIGVEFDSGGVYAAQVEQGKNGFAARGYFAHRFDASQSESKDLDREIESALRRIAQSRAFRGRRISLLLPAHLVFSYPLRMQVQKEETVEQAILREAGNILPFPVEEALLDYASIEAPPPGKPGNGKVLLVAIRKKDLDHYVGLAQRAGLVPELVDFRASTLIRLHTHLYGMPEQPVLLCHVGRQDSTLAIVTADSIVAHRNVNGGTQPLIDKLVDNLDLPSDGNDALFLLKEHGLVYTSDAPAEAEDEGRHEVRRAVYQLVAPIVDELIHELHNLMGYVRSEFQDTTFDQVYVYGNGVEVNGLASYIERQVNIPTRNADLAEKIAPKNANPAPALIETAPYALALGLAIRNIKWL